MRQTLIALYSLCLFSVLPVGLRASNERTKITSLGLASLEGFSVPRSSVNAVRIDGKSIRVRDQEVLSLTPGRHELLLMCSFNSTTPAALVISTGQSTVVLDAEAGRSYRVMGEAVNNFTAELWIEDILAKKKVSALLTVTLKQRTQILNIPKGAVVRHVN